MKCTCNANNSIYIVLCVFIKIWYFSGHSIILCIFFIRLLLIITKFLTMFNSLGIVCFVWFILWMALAANSPSEHRFVSEAERKYIEASIEPPVGLTFL